MTEEKKRIGRPPFQEVAYAKALTVRISEELHNKLKKDSTDKRIPVMHLVRILLEEIYGLDND